MSSEASQAVSVPAAPLPAESSGWFGPLFFWEMTRESRKGTSYLPRVVYACGLLLLLYLVMGNAEITQKRIAQLCEEAFKYYLVLQYMAIVLLTPAYVAGVIIEDRQQRTLSLLLTTHLTAREIVLGKMMGRLVPMLGILLAGVPVLAILQLLGGISMGWLAFHSIMALILVVTVGMFAIRASTLCKTVGGAVISTYASLFGISCFFIPFSVMLASGARSLDGLVILLIVMVGSYFFFAWLAVVSAIKTLNCRDRDQDIVLSEMERAEQQVSSVPLEKPLIVRAETPALSEEETKSTNSPQQSEEVRKLPMAGNWPIIWKEIHFPTTELIRIFASLFCGLPLVISVADMLVYVFEKARHQHEVQTFIVESAHFLLTILLIMTTLRAAGTLVTERKRQTLISLLTTPLSWNRIILEFWLGSIWRHRELVIGTLLVTLTTAVYDPQSIFSVPAFVSQLAFSAMLGIASSLVFQTAFQARLMLSLYFFFSYFILPSMKMLPGMTYFWLIELLLVPYRSWPKMVTEGRLPGNLRTWDEFTLTSPFLFHVVFFINLVMIWVLTYLLFRFCRYRLQRWIDRGLA